MEGILGYAAEMGAALFALSVKLAESSRRLFQYAHGLTERVTIIHPVPSV